MPENPRNKVRIIGGRLRGRVLLIPKNVPEIRPTSSRVRETLFNWLSTSIVGAHCLDVCAGTGALGIEALSRGAAHVTAVDVHPSVSRHLQKHKKTFQLGETYQVFCEDAVCIFNKPVFTSTNILFWDPPFQNKELIQSTLQSLQENILQASELKWIYIESKRDEKIEIQGFKEYRHLKTKEVLAVLYKRAH